MREQNEKAVQAMRAFLKALGLDLEQCGMEQIRGMGAKPANGIQRETRARTE